MVGVHPLKPSQGVIVEVEGGNGDPLIHGGVVKFEELGDFKDPAARVGTIEAWNVQTQRVAWSHHRGARMKWSLGMGILRWRTGLHSLQSLDNIIEFLG